MLRLRTFGGLSIENALRIGAAAAHRRPLALLALLAVEGRRGMSRDKIVALLWPESDAEHGRNSLSQVLSSLRRELAVEDIVIGTVELRLNSDVLVADVSEFEKRVDAGDLESAVSLYTGPFLDGVFLKNAPEFERWVDQERSRLQQAQGDALERLAWLATDRGDPMAAVRWWRRRVSLAPSDSRAALRLMESLVAAGDPAGALEQYRLHHALLREDLGLEPDATLAEFAAAVRAREGHSPAVPSLVVPRAVSGNADTAPGAHEPREDSLGVEPSGIPRDRGAMGRLRPYRWLIAAAAGVFTTVAVVAVLLHGRDAPRLDPNLVAIAPFRVSGAKPDLAFLREGMLDLLAVRLSSPGGPRAADTRTLLNTWHRTLPTATADPSREDALAVAARLGAGRLLLGGIVGTPSHLTLTASLLAVPGGAQRVEASVEGPNDSLTTLVDRLVAQLVTREAGEGARSLWFARTSLPVIQAYLAGQAAYRQSRYADAAMRFEEALAIDSTFAPAALGLATSAYWPPKLSPKTERALALAWTGRARLSEADRLVLTAMVPAGYPERTGASVTARAHLAKWRRALTVSPDLPLAWYYVGDDLFHWGPTLTENASLEGAAAAFQRALELDSSFVPALDHLLAIRIVRRDTAAVRRDATRYFSLDSTSDNAEHMRWAVAVALGDSAPPSTMRRRFARLPTETLGFIIGEGLQRLVRLDDAEAAAAVLRRRRLTSEDPMILQAVRALDLNRGRPAATLEDGYRRLPRRRARELQIAHALYWDGDTTAAAGAARELSNSTNPQRSPDDAFDVYTNLPEREWRIRERCLLEQWRVRHGETGTARGAIATLRRLESSADSATIDPATPLCVALLDAILASTERRADAAAALDRLEALTVKQGQFFGLDPEYVHASNLVIAQLRAARGEYARALAAIRRRSYSTLYGWIMLSSYLREEGRLANLAGDRSGAIRAYRHYLALRSHPEPSLAGEVARVREELDRLERSP